MAIQLVIFDIGGILIDVNFDNVIYYWAKKSGFPKIDIDVRNSTYFDFERGKASAHDYHQSIISQFDMNLSFDDFVIGWNSMLVGVKPGIEILLKKLSHTKLAILSNTNPLHEKEFFKHYRKLMLNFDHLGFSHHLGLLKPEPEAYLVVLKHFGIYPSQTVFIDDKQENVDAAKSLGLYAICSNSATDIVNRLTGIIVYER